MVDFDALTFFGVDPAFCPQCADWTTDRLPIHTQYVQPTDFRSIEFLRDQTDEQIQMARLLNAHYPSAVVALNDSIRPAKPRAPRGMLCQAFGGLSTCAAISMRRYMSVQSHSSVF